jgi:hypothetical protein
MWKSAVSMPFNARRFKAFLNRIGVLTDAPRACWRPAPQDAAQLGIAARCRTPTFFRHLRIGEQKIEHRGRDAREFRMQAHCS